jgi:hypothetical protein
MSSVADAMVTNANAIVEGHPKTEITRTWVDPPEGPGLGKYREVRVGSLLLALPRESVEARFQLVVVQGLDILSAPVYVVTTEGELRKPRMTGGEMELGCVSPALEALVAESVGQALHVVLAARIVEDAEAIVASGDVVVTAVSYLDPDGGFYSHAHIPGMAEEARVAVPCDPRQSNYQAVVFLGHAHRGGQSYVVTSRGFPVPDADPDLMEAGLADADTDPIQLWQVVADKVAIEVAQLVHAARERAAA